MSVDNVVRASFVFGKSTKTRGLHQWDYGQMLKFEGLPLPASYTVHFANQLLSGTAKTQVGDSDGVDIPDEYLTTGLPVYAWVYLHTGADDGETVYSVTIPVTQRPQPTEEPPTPQQQGAIDQAIAALNAGVEQVEGIAEGIPATIDAALQEAKDSGEFDGPQGPGVPAGGTAGQVLQKASGADYDTEWVEPSSGGAVTSVNGKTGAVTLNASDVGAGTYSKPSGGIPSTDMSSEVQASLGKADTALQSAPVTSVNTKTGAVVLTPSDIGAGTYSKPSGGIPKTDLASGVQSSLDAADTAYQKPSGGIPASDLASGVIPSVPVTDVQVNGTSILDNGVADVPIAKKVNSLGLMYVGYNSGLSVSSSGQIKTTSADNTVIKAGTNANQPIVPKDQHASAFYGLAKAAGDATQSQSANLVGTYTDGAKAAIKSMIGADEWRLVADLVMANGDGAFNVTLTEAVANVFCVLTVLAASQNTSLVVDIEDESGIDIAYKYLSSQISTTAKKSLIQVDWLAGDGLLTYNSGDDVQTYRTYKSNSTPAGKIKVIKLKGYDGVNMPDGSTLKIFVK